jgi:hypothetical protein
MSRFNHKTAEKWVSSGPATGPGRRWWDLFRRRDRHREIGADWSAWLYLGMLALALVLDHWQT